MVTEALGDFLIFVTLADTSYKATFGLIGSSTLTIFNCVMFCCGAARVATDKLVATHMMPINLNVFLFLTPPFFIIVYIFISLYIIIT